MVWPADSMLLQLGDNSFRVTDELLPAVGRALIVGLLIGTEAGLLHAQMSTGFPDSCPHHGPAAWLWPYCIS